jgi:hypothetical protein
MDLRKKMSLAFVLLSFSILLIIFSRGESLKTSPPAEKDKEKPIAETKIPSPPLEIPLSEKEYVEKASSAVELFQEFTDSLLVKNNSGADIASSSESEKKKIESINIVLNEAKVPTRFKSFHLLFSRSLLKFSGYLESRKEDERKAGLELFGQAKSEYERLLASS